MDYLILRLRTTGEFNENIDTFEGGHVPRRVRKKRRVRQKRSPPDDTEPKPISKPQMHDSSSNARYSSIINHPSSVSETLSLLSSSSNGSSILQSASNVGVFGGNFVTLTVNANCAAHGVIFLFDLTTFAS